MTNITLAPPIVGEKNTTAEPKVGTAIKAIEEYLNQTVLGTGIGTGNIIKESITEEKLSTAVQTLLNKAAAGLIMTKQAGSTTGSSGNLYLMETNATTLTLPAATSGRQVGVICKNAIEEVKMKATGVKIFGDFLAAAGVETIGIRENQHVIVEADGTNWWIIAGEPANTNLYAAELSVTLGEAEAGITISKARPAIVTVMAEMTTNQGLEITVTGKRVSATAQTATGTITVPLTFRVGAAQVWKAKAITAYTASVKYVSVLL